MATTYNYRNLHSVESITKQQAEMSNYYRKATFVDNNIQKVERIINGNIQKISLYKQQGQTFEQLRQQIMTEYTEMEYFSLRERERVGNYIKEITIDYENFGSEVFGMSLSVYDSKGRSIGSKEIIDISTMQLGIGSVKFFYSKTVWEDWCKPNLELKVKDPEFLVFIASYDETNGSLEEVKFNIMSSYDKEFFAPNPVGNEQPLEELWFRCGFNQTQIDYFLSADLFPIPSGLDQ